MTLNNHPRRFGRAWPRSPVFPRPATAGETSPSAHPKIVRQFFDSLVREMHRVSLRLHAALDEVQEEATRAAVEKAIDCLNQAINWLHLAALGALHSEHWCASPGPRAGYHLPPQSD